MNMQNIIDKLRKHHRMGHIDRARELLPDKDIDDPEFKLIKGIILIFSGDESGRKYLEEAILHPAKTLKWQSDLGLAYFLLGRIDKAREILEDLVKKNQADAVIFGRLGAVRLALLDLDGAKQAYEEAIKREPGRAEWHNNLAGILVRQQKLEEALENYELALKLKPDLEQAKESRFKVLNALDRTDEIVEELESELKKDLDNLQIRIRLALAYELDNQPGKAVRILNEALISLDEVEDEQKQDQFKLRLALADIFLGRDNHYLAYQALKQAEKLTDEPAIIIARQANCLVEMDKKELAFEAINRALELESDNLAIKVIHSNVLSEAGKYEEAEELLKELLKTYPGDPQLLTRLGQIYMWLGELDKAEECFVEASKLNPVAITSLVDIKKMPEDDDSIELMKKMAENVFLPKELRANFYFGLSRIYDKKGEYDKAFQYLDNANKLIKKTLNYNPENFSKRIDAIIRVFNKDFFEKLPPIRRAVRTPVFVVGMPRSGTTLTEQILASHSKVFGAGELPYIPKLIALIPRVLKAKRPFPWCVVRLTPHLREEAARFYLHQLDLLDPDNHPFVVDKLPHNFVNLGLIAMIFPGAKIIHVNRDPRDVAVSNYQQNFKAKHGGMGFAFDLEWIAKQINDYLRIMEHWRKVLPLPIYELQYEELVENPEKVIKEVLDFLGLEWEDSVLDFYKAKRAVKTASVTQVRNPIYKSSKAKWRRYEKYLGPLLDNISEK